MPARPELRLPFCGTVSMDGDLQDPPELIPDLVAKWRQGGAKVIVLNLKKRVLII